jgi:hypothetical protein
MTSRRSLRARSKGARPDGPPRRSMKSSSGRSTGAKWSGIGRGNGTNGAGRVLRLGRMLIGSRLIRLSCGSCQTCYGISARSAHRDQVAPDGVEQRQDRAASARCGIRSLARRIRALCLLWRVVLSAQSESRQSARVLLRMLSEPQTWTGGLRNAFVMRKERVDDAVLRTLGGDVLRPAVVTAVLEGVFDAMRPDAMDATLSGFGASSRPSMVRLVGSRKRLPWAATCRRCSRR